MYFRFFSLVLIPLLSRGQAFEAWEVSNKTMLLMVSGSTGQNCLFVFKSFILNVFVVTGEGPKYFLFELQVNMKLQKPFITYTFSFITCVFKVYLTTSVAHII